MYTLKTWANENSQPETRTDLPYALAYAIATKAGWYKSQVVDGLGIILLETKNNGE